MYNGVINIYKEPGFTSHDVVAKLRGMTHQKKIGHTGTLDPAAEGVLCVCLGAATHVCDMLTDENKEYEAVLLLGVSTDTQDTTGQILSNRPVEVTENQIREVISHYIGEINQIPPMYSALKVDGKKLYELARAGKSVERKPRKITVFDIEICDISLPRVTIKVTCSKGTYIRTLCNDIGEELGCGGAMEHLTRTRVGRFEIKDAKKLNEVNEYIFLDNLESILISPSDMFDKLPVVTPNERGEKMASNGNVLYINDVIITEPVSGKQIGEDSLHNKDEFRVISKTGFFYGVYYYDVYNKLFKPLKMFLCD